MKWSEQKLDPQSGHFSGRNSSRLQVDEEHGWPMNSIEVSGVPFLDEDEEEEGPPFDWPAFVAEEGRFSGDADVYGD